MTKNSVFLFRHCIRSTQRRQSLHLRDETVETYYEAADFIQDGGLPDWQTPAHYDCTKAGLQALQGSGKQLLRELLEDIDENDDSAPKVIHFQLIADDKSQRDVDSALSLQHGILEQLEVERTKRDSLVIIRGLERMEFDSTLFRGTCTSNDNKLSLSFRELIKSQVQRRLQMIEPPIPNQEETLKKIEKRAGGPGQLGSMHDISYENDIDRTAAQATNTTYPAVVVTEEGGVYLAGPINIISWFAEMAFYSRASGIWDAPFLRNLTFSEVYRLLEYHHYFRSIVSMENEIVAQQGVLVGRAILQALRYGHVRLPLVGPSSCWDERESASLSTSPPVTHKVTLIVGHDGDMNAIATAFGLRWRLPQPHHTSKGNYLGQYVPTPPGSAMQFDYHHDTVNMSFRFPVSVERFDDTTAMRIPKGMQMNDTGLLERVALIVKPRWTTSLSRTAAANLSEDGNTMMLLENGWEVLEAQLQDTVLAFPSTTECPPSQVMKVCSKPLVIQVVNLLYVMLVLCTAILSFLGILYLRGYRCRRDRNTKGPGVDQYQYNSVSPTESFEK